MNTLIIVLSFVGIVLGVFMAVSALDLNSEAAASRVRSAMLLGLLAALSVTNSFTLDAQLSTLQEQSVTQQAILQKSQTTISDLKGALAGTKSKVETLELRNGLAQRANESLTVKLQNAHQELAESKKELAKVKAENKVGLKEYNDLKAKYEKLRGVLQEIKGVTR